MLMFFSATLYELVDLQPQQRGKREIYTLVTAINSSMRYSIRRHF